MIRLALPKGRNLEPALAAFRAAGFEVGGLAADERRLRLRFPGDGIEVLLIKDWDVPLYVQYGVADCGIVGTDVLEEIDGDLLAPVRLRDGGCRLSLIGRPGSMPVAGSQVRLATKYPQIARRVVAEKPWGAEIVRLAGSVELAPLLDLAEIAIDVVQTGRTLAENHLVELEVVREVQPCLVINRGSFQGHRRELNSLVARLEAAEVVL